MLGKDDIKGSLGVKEQDIQGEVEGVETVENALGEENTTECMGAPRVHGLSGSSGVVPALAIVIHDVEIQCFGQDR